MTNDTSRKTGSDGKGDPLGLRSLDLAIDRLSSLREESGVQVRVSRWGICVDHLKRAFEETRFKHELLKDRYALLKRSNAQLADEVAWLRDQLDDAHTDGSVKAVAPPLPPARSSRRYDDRGPR